MNGDNGCIYCTVGKVDPASGWAPYCGPECAVDAANDEHTVVVKIAVLCGVAVNRLQDAPGLRRLARKCWPKEQHRTQGAAEAAMRSLLKRGLEKDAEKLHAYLCPFCKFWHTGHGLGGV